MKFMNKEEAFNWLGDDQKNVPIDFDAHAFRFTKRWFRSRNQKTWSSFLPDKFSHDDPVNMIQIGVFEGMDLVWCCQNFLGHPDSRVLAIDPWHATRKLNQAKMDNVKANAEHNLRPWRDKVQIIQGDSDSVLTDLIDNGATAINDKPIKTGEWDLIVIDGDHNQVAVYEDACNAFQLARKGGWLLFDDYHNQIKKKKHVQDGVKMFVEDFGDDLVLAWQHRYCVCLEVTC